ncbi:hypothetical protein GH714_041504 [Hevea brasiliensis]|uniref:Uncharacterized protein n=1 Tax=Hevea brasiliensis TaxID=3981 RepID=A0A6A6MVE4_HEVBR|nr:hypothetical protein GH714_041504 [Hevea brasiliensis]
MEDDEGDNLRPNIPSPSPEHDAMAGGCGTEFTRMNSDSSALTVDTSKDFSLHNASSIPGPSTVWTDEKHSLYLDSLEATFVNQLHHSIALHGCLQKTLWGPYSFRTLKTNSCNSSHQFIVLQDGSRTRSNLDRSKPLLDSTADSHFIQKSPWIRHFASAGKRRIAAFMVKNIVLLLLKEFMQEGVLQSAVDPQDTHNTLNVAYAITIQLALPKNVLQCYATDSCGNKVTDTEVSDQNFVDEDQGEKSSSMAMVKRLEIVEADASSNDQVVPFATSKLNNFQASSEKEKQAQPQLLPEKTDNFVYPKSDQYFIRES